MKNNTVKILVFVGVILLVPVAGNLFVEGWNWDLFDFIFAGTLLFITGLAIDFAIQKLVNPIHKILATVLIIGVLLMVWVELAVDGVSQLLSF
jgi:hypothetical protein